MSVKVGAGDQLQGWLILAAFGSVGVLQGPSSAGAAYAIEIEQRCVEAPAF